MIPTRCSGSKSKNGIFFFIIELRRRARKERYISEDSEFHEPHSRLDLSLSTFWFQADIHGQFA